MYDAFDPMGEALGLPPRRVEARHEWIDLALFNRVNACAFASTGEVIGHCFLVADGARSAEMAVFVHQDFRRMGAGTALVNTALAWVRAEGIRRVWTLTGAENRAALRLQERCGFRVVQLISDAVELEIELAAVAEQAA
jgi:GNAT superfamily N-acetyltransferase